MVKYSAVRSNVAINMSASHWGLLKRKNTKKPEWIIN